MKTLNEPVLRKVYNVHDCSKLTGAKNTPEKLVQNNTQEKISVTKYFGLHVVFEKRNAELTDVKYILAY